MQLEKIILSSLLTLLSLILNQWNRKGKGTNMSHKGFLVNSYCKLQEWADSFQLWPQMAWGYAGRFYLLRTSITCSGKKCPRQVLLTKTLSARVSLGLWRLKLEVGSLRPPTVRKGRLEEIYVKSCVVSYPTEIQKSYSWANWCNLMSRVFNATRREISTNSQVISFTTVVA